MQINIEKMRAEHKKEVIDMMAIFYESEAVHTNGSAKIFEADFENCIGNSPYIDGFVFTQAEKVLGYAMIAHSFSTEYGKECIWFEDLYLKPEFRGFGIIPNFFNFIETEYKNTIFRLEVEKENEHAVHVYKKHKFSDLPYHEMVKI